MKRKKGGKGKGKDGSGTAGEILVMPFLSQFPLPADGSDPRSEEVIKYVLFIFLLATTFSWISMSFGMSSRIKF
jgi:hypothetical protein